MSLRDDPNYFPQPDVPNNGNYGNSFGKEQLYYDYLPRLAAIEAANVAAGEKTYSSGKYTYNPATGQYTWVPAGAVVAKPGAGVNAGADMGDIGGGGGQDRGDGRSTAPGGGYGIPGATMSGGISGPTTGLASGANSLAATLGNMSSNREPGIVSRALRGISDTLAANVDPSFSHEGRPGRGTGTVDSGYTGNLGSKSGLGSFSLGPDGLTSMNAPTAAESQARADAVSGVDVSGGNVSGAATGTSGGTPADAGDGSVGKGDAPGDDHGGEANGGMIGHYSQGGLGSLGGYSDGGRLLRGPGDGVSDSIPATIGKAKQPARLADGEFVVPSRIVSELGNGSTEAGARKLYAMLARIQAGRKKSIGRSKVAVNSRMDKYLPA